MGTEGTTWGVRGWILATAEVTLRSDCPPVPTQRAGTSMTGASVDPQRSHPFPPTTSPLHPTAATPLHSLLPSHSAQPAIHTPPLSLAKMTSMMATPVYLLSSLLTFLVLLLPITSSLAPSYDPNTPLILSDVYLTNSTTIAEARKLSLVTSLPSLPTLPFLLNSALFPISPNCSLYFQLYSSASAAPRTPLIVFLAGGPGLAGSLWTLYGGVTPLLFNASSPNAPLNTTSTSWASNAAVLVIDYPSGVGFSNCTTRAQSVAAAVDELKVFMQGFFAVWPEFEGEVYVAGHSYGGRTAPDLAVALIQSGHPIAGVIVESGLTEAYLSFSETCNAVYLQGMATPTEFAYCTAALQAVDSGIRNHSESSTQSAISALLSTVWSTNANNAYQDFQRSFSFINQEAMEALLSSPEARLALHVGSLPYSGLLSYSFSDHWSGESLTSLDLLLGPRQETRVLYFASNKDSLIGSSALRLLNATEYNRRTQWANTRRATPLTMEGGSATRGFLKRDLRLWFATLYDASHEISIVSPLARRLISDFTSARPPSEESSVLESATPLPSLSEQLHRGGEKRKSAPVLSSADPVVSPAVYLTPYLGMANGADLAQSVSAVTLPGRSELRANSTYAGYITVNQTYGSNSFFWFLPSLDGNASAPLILHLSGGPGISSMAMGFLYQHGPFQVVQEGEDPLATRPRMDNFNEHNHMLYVDNPIGTGFSYTMDSRGLRTNSRQIAGDLYELLRQFYTLFPSYRTSRLYVHGVSYAGRFLPTLGAHIHMENQRRPAAEYMPFEGLFIASGWMDQAIQTSQEVDFLVSIGRVDPFNRNQLIGADLDYYNCQRSTPPHRHSSAVLNLTHLRAAGLCDYDRCVGGCVGGAGG